MILALGLIGPAVLEALLDEKRSEWPRVLLALVAVHGLGGRCVLPNALRAGIAADAGQNVRSRRCARLDHGMAAAGLGHFGAFEFLLLAGSSRCRAG